MPTITVLDLETGGFNPKTSAIVSAAAVVLDSQLREIDRWYAVINEPGKEITDDALAINGLSRDQIASGIPIEMALEEIRRRSITTWVAHNAAFDFAFINARGNFGGIGEPGQPVNLAIDTMFLAWHVWPRPAKAKLGIVAERMGINVENAHNALGDVLMTVEILRKFASMGLAPDPLVPQLIQWEWWKRR